MYTAKVHPLRICYIVICSTDIIPIYLYKWEALSFKHVPVYAEMAEGSKLPWRQIDGGDV